MCLGMKSASCGSQQGLTLSFVFTGQNPVQEPTGWWHQSGQVHQLLQHEDVGPSARRWRLSRQAQARPRQVSPTSKYCHHQEGSTQLWLLRSADFALLLQLDVIITPQFTLTTPFCVRECWYERNVLVAVTSPLDLFFRLSSIPLGAGQFDRGLYLEGIRRRITRELKRREAMKNQSSSTVCTIS